MKLQEARFVWLEEKKISNLGYMLCNYCLSIFYFLTKQELDFIIHRVHKNIGEKMYSSIIDNTEFFPQLLKNLPRKSIK